MKEINDKDYYSIPALSASQIKEYAKSPYHFWKTSVFNINAIPISSPSMDFGKACHCWILEQEKFFEEYIVNDNEFDFRTKEGKEWKSLQTKTILSKSEFKQIQKMKECLMQDNLVNAILSEITPEKPFITSIGDGYDIKCKMDGIKRIRNTNNQEEIIIIDYKTTSQEVAKFERQSLDLFYDIQVAIYCQMCFIKYGVFPAHFYLITQSSKENYEDMFQTFEYDSQSIDRAMNNVFGTSRQLDFVIDENSNIKCDESFGLIYKCKKDIYEFMQGINKEAFRYSKQQVIMLSNLYREFYNNN